MMTEKRMANFTLEPASIADRSARRWADVGR